MEIYTVPEYTPNTKLLLLQSMKEAFISEHGGTKDLRLQLDIKFRKERKTVEAILDRTDSHSFNNNISFQNILRARHLQMADLSKEIIKDKQIELDDLVSSYIHMTINRSFRSRQRTHEMVIYDFLYRYYKSKLAKEIQTLLTV
ncbi:MAG: thiopeptide-type bacteriocin biosynthesis protein [Bacteroidia bacterium]